MDINRAITILEALAAGCSPATGEKVHDESVLNEREVIRALQIAIDKLKNRPSSQNYGGVMISEDDIRAALEVFEKENLNPTVSRLAGFFLATRRFKNEHIVSNEHYGKYKGIYQKGQLIDFFAHYFSESEPLPHNTSWEADPWKKIDFFQKAAFNKLSEAAINQLKGKVKDLGIVKTDNLSEHVLNARIVYPRAYEPWTDAEKELLRKALQYTNDLDLLSRCFQRGPGSIESCGKRLIYESEKLQDAGTQS